MQRVAHYSMTRVPRKWRDGRRVAGACHSRRHHEPSSDRSITKPTDEQWPAQIGASKNIRGAFLHTSAFICVIQSINRLDQNIRLASSGENHYLVYRMLQRELQHDPSTKEWSMKIWQSLLKRLEEYSQRIEREHRDAYLAEASDVYDLEYRIRKLDKQAHRLPRMDEVRLW